MTTPDLPLRIALDIADPALAERVAQLLAEAQGFALVAPGEAADLALSVARPGAEADLPLTAREAEVLSLLAEGLSNPAIARRLGISVHTAKFHVKALLDKLDAIGRTDAVAHAVRLGLIQL